MKDQIITDKKGKIQAITKSVPGKKHDKKLFDETKPILPEKSNLTGDLGYYGADGITFPNKKPKDKELTKQRIKVEHFFCKMKIYQILLKDS